MAAGEKSNQLLGEYLSSAGLLRAEELREAANIARNQNLPIGKVLIMSGYISKELLHIAIELQARVRDGRLDYKNAVHVLTLISKENMPLDKALSAVNQRSISYEDGNRLGEFLWAANLVTETELNSAKEESKRCGLPLGRMLVNLGMVSESILNNVLRMQSLVRSGKITKVEAVSILVASKGRQIEVQPLCAGKDIAAGSTALPTNADITGNRIADQLRNLPNISLHQMLRAAGLTDTALLEKAIKDGLEDPQIMTAIIRRSQILEDFVIEAAAQCCQLIAKGLLKPEQAIIALHQCQRTRNSLEDCLIEYGWLPSRQKVSS